MQILKKLKQSKQKLTHITLRQSLKFSINIKKGKILQCFKKIHRFVGDALVTGTKF